MVIRCIESTGSTNNWVAENEGTLPSPCIVRCHTQLAGRGQRGNSWESAPGLNFTGSLLLHPKSMHASRQFMLSEAVALAIVDTLADYGLEGKVKWPNDIYIGNKKICGILVEHVITGHEISRTIAGIGLNINQEKFFSDAPNPTSMKMETRISYKVDEVTSRLAVNLEKRLQCIAGAILPEDMDTSGCSDALHTEFMATLWRNDGEFHPFMDKKSGEGMMAKIADVGKDGILCLITSGGEKRNYAFKEIEFII